MKKMIKCLFYVLLSVFLFASCEVDRPEPVFSDPPSVRIDQKIEELKTLLISQEQGFSGIYFPNNTQVGGISFHMNFSEDERVKITSDFKSTTGLTDTRYFVAVGTTAAELVFSSGSRHITDLIQNGAQGFDTFFGNNAFQYVGEEAGVITFNEVRSGGILELSPSGFTNFDTESVASADITYANKNEFVNTPLTTAFPFFSIEKDGQEITYNLNYDESNLFASPSGFDTNGIATEEKFGIAFTEVGLTISPPLEYNGVIFKDFILDTSSGFEYIATVSGATAKIGYGNTPPAPLDSYSFGISQAAVFNMDEPFKHTSPFIAFFENFSDNLSISLPGIVIENIIMWNLNTGDTPFLQIRTNFGWVNYEMEFDYNESTGIVIFNLTGVTDAPDFFTVLLQPMLDLFVGSSKGYYTLNSGNYLNFSNQTFSLINADNPAHRMDYWTF